jgi:hypothetical protein
MATAVNVGVEVTKRALTRETLRRRRRRISPDAGRALEMLGHAIEYLTDVYVHETENLCASDPQVEAIQLLMRLNRQVYYECPVAPTLAERVASFFAR